MDENKGRAAATSELSAGLGAWQPIETAPKDGTTVIVFVPPGKYHSGRTVTVRWTERDIGYWHVDDGKRGPFPLRGGEPTHWMPLPEAPN